MAEHNTVFLIIIFSLFILAAVIQLFYYLFFYLPVYREKQTLKENKPPVSVIICARNEAENLASFLPSVLGQDYPDYEVIVVNDCSEDESYDILGGFLEQYPHLRISTITKDPKFTHNKRFAQFIGIKAAKNEVLVFTDADCQPTSPKWLEGIASHFDDNTTFVLGYGGYLKGKGILGKYISYDTMVIAMQYLGMALRGFPYMGVGRNLAYRRSLFFDNKGFGTHNHLISGDDDLFVNSHANKANTCIEYRAETHTRSVPARNLNEWIAQKKRHFTTAPLYKTRDIFLLLLEPSARLIFYITFIILISFTFLWPYVISVFLIRLAAEITIFTLVQKRLNEEGIVGWAMAFDIISPLINTILFVTNIVRKPGNNRWK
jgi:poly-beta-1,6-N-acetyl-D-glucosamine synthase